MFRTFALAFALTAVVTSPVSAANEEAVPKQLPQSIQKVLKDDTERGIVLIATMMLEIQSDGIISRVDLGNVYKSGIARHRAKMLVDTLAMDLDFDGSLTQEELAFARTTPLQHNTNARIQMELMILDADTNEDGAVSFDEMRLHVIKNDRLGKHRPTRRYPILLADLMELDMNGDGEVDIPEMIKAIRAATAR